MKIHGDALETTTLPFPTKCRRCQRLYAFFRTRFTRWHASVFPDTRQSTSAAAAGSTVLIPKATQSLACQFPHTMSPGMCRTQKPDRLSDLAERLRVKIDCLETHGGMGRIYALRDADKVLKIADVRTSWCKHESRNYSVLVTAGIPSARVVSSIMTTVSPGKTYAVMVLERLDFTLTAYLRALARTAECVTTSARAVVQLISVLLHSLQAHDLVFGDLSPDNIMFRCLDSDSGDSDSPGTYELALIDPQFLCPLPLFEEAVGRVRGRAFDTTYVALKIQAIGLLDKVCAPFTNAVCAGLLGHTPPEKHTRQWLLHEAPVGLFMAYDVLRQANRTGRPDE